MTLAIPHEPVPGFAELGFFAGTTTREAGSFNLMGDEPASRVVGRWMGLMEALAPCAVRLASAHQVHGDRVLEHGDAWPAGFATRWVPTDTSVLLRERPWRCHWPIAFPSSSPIRRAPAPCCTVDGRAPPPASRFAPSPCSANEAWPSATCWSTSAPRSADAATRWVRTCTGRSPAGGWTDRPPWISVT